MKRFCTLFLTCVFFITINLSVSYAKDATILLAFGTSDPEAKKALDSIGKAYEKRGDKVLWVYSSNIIREKLKSQKKPVFSIEEALDEAAMQGYKNITIQSLHVAPAEEYMKVNRLIARSMEKNPNRFESVVFGHALLMSAKDLQETIVAVIQAIPQKRKADEAVILMGHGNNRGTGDLILMTANTEFQKTDPLIWLANVEGSLPFDRLLPKLKAAKVKRVWLMPFMIVAGDHAKNDMAGSEADSWTSILKAQGYDVKIVINGMGELEGIQNIFLRHSSETVDDIMNGTIIK